MHDPLLDALRKFSQLLEHPEPGLSTWHVACEIAAITVVNEITKARGGQPIYIPCQNEVR